MKPSALDPHAHVILVRARQGYTRLMLHIFLLETYKVSRSVAAISRWLVRHAAELAGSTMATDDEFEKFRHLATLYRPHRAYRRRLAEWCAHIQHMRAAGASIAAIRADLKQRGVEVSPRSIRRELQVVGHGQGN
jgi:hypothetical protein